MIVGTSNLSVLFKKGEGTKCPPSRHPRLMRASRFSGSPFMGVVSVSDIGVVRTVSVFGGSSAAARASEALVVSKSERSAGRRSNEAEEKTWRICLK